MPRPLLKKQTENATSFGVSSRKKSDFVDQSKMDQLLRRRRSKRYMEILAQLDAGGHVQNKDQVEKIIAAIREEFPEMDICGLKGYLSVCYLGHPYEVHILDVLGEILEHYEIGTPLPHGLDRVRALAVRGGYEVIEIYENCCRAIGRDGSVSVIPL